MPKGRSYVGFQVFHGKFTATLKALTPKIAVALAGAAGILLYIHMRGWMLLPPVVIVSALVVRILCACLAFTSLLASLWASTRDMRQQIARMLFRQRAEIEIGRTIKAAAQFAVGLVVLAKQQ